MPIPNNGILQLYHIPAWGICQIHETGSERIGIYKKAELLRVPSCVCKAHHSDVSYMIHSAGQAQAGLM